MLNDDYSEITDIKSVVLYMMQFIFIEIRAAETIHAARKFADVFHNVPVSLLKCRSLEEERRMLDNIFTRSKKYDMDQYIKQLIELANKEVLIMNKDQSS